MVYPWNMKKMGMRKQKNGPGKCQPESTIIEDVIGLTEECVVHDFDDEVYVEIVVDLGRLARSVCCIWMYLHFWLDDWGGDVR